MTIKFHPVSMVVVFSNHIKVARCRQGGDGLLSSFRVSTWLDHRQEGQWGRNVERVVDGSGNTRQMEAGMEGSQICLLVQP